MRHPLNPGYRITTQFSSAHPGTDYAPPTRGQTGVPCYAPEKSTVVRSALKTVEGNYVMLQGHDTGKFYYFGHFAERRVSVGQTIGEGTIIGILGMTGAATGIHTHCEVRNTLVADFANKHNPEAWFQAHITKGGEKPMTAAEEANAYRIVLGREMEHGGTGRTGYQFITAAVGELNAQRAGVQQTIQSLQTALANEQSKPPREIVKEVEKIVTEYVDRPVEVIKEVPIPVDEQKVVFGIIKRAWEAISKFLFRKRQ